MSLRTFSSTVNTSSSGSGMGLIASVPLKGTNIWKEGRDTSNDLSWLLCIAGSDHQYLPFAVRGFNLLIQIPAQGHQHHGIIRCVLQNKLICSRNTHWFDCVKGTFAETKTHVASWRKRAIGVHNGVVRFVPPADGWVTYHSFLGHLFIRIRWSYKRELLPFKGSKWGERSKSHMFWLFFFFATLTLV